MNIPILFLVFNRPNTTKRVFESIRQAQPPRLYIAADGPRENHPGELEKCMDVRSIVTNVDWDCEIKTLLRDNNLGCRNAVSSAIDWFFDQEEMGIILEDDCLPNQSFYQFCEELLYKYANEEKVMTISGDNFQPERRTENSYYFSKYMHCWGWASWKRAWKHYDIHMQEWPELKKGNFLSGLFKSRAVQKYWENILDKVYANEIDTWDYQWNFSIWKADGVNIIPEVNLVSNIGEVGTHTESKKSDSIDRDTLEMSFPLKNPDKIEINKAADSYIFNNQIFGSNIFSRSLAKLKLLLKH